MSSKVRCYLRTQRRQWELTQVELASLLPKGSRNRVSRVERGLTPPDATEILAYALIFGSSARDLFPRFAGDIDDAVMQHAYKLHRRLERADSAVAGRKRQLIERMLGRATGHVKRQTL